jgi:hypothetical protein
MQVRFSTYCVQGFNAESCTFNAQDSKIIIVIVQVEAVKIYVAFKMYGAQENERRDETQFTTKIFMGF